MPRARNLKPGFFKDAKVVGCSFEARLLFQGLWCLADYKGRLKYVPLEIKMEVFPADNVDIEKCMQELSDQGLIQIYHDHSGAALVQVTNFSLHQNPHVNEKQDRNKKPLPCLPSPEECKSEGVSGSDEKEDIKQRVTDALRVLREYSESDPADSLLLIPDSLLLLPEDNADKSASSEYAFEGESFRINQKDFEAHRKIYPNLNLMVEYQQLDIEVRDTPKKQRWGAINAKLNYRNKNSQSGYQQSGKSKLSTIEQATEHNAEYARRLQEQIDSGSFDGDDQTLAVVN